MKVKALVGFSSTQGSYSKGEVFDLPRGTDWLKAGLVEKVKPKRSTRKAKA